MPTQGEDALKAYQEKLKAEQEAKAALDKENADKSAAHQAEIERQKEAALAIAEKRKADEASAIEAKRIAEEAKKNEGNQSEEEKKLAVEKEAQRIEAEKKEKERLEAEEKEKSAKKEIDYDSIDIDKVIEKKTKGKFKKWEEAEAKLNFVPEAEDPFIEGLKKANKQGVSYETYVKVQNIDTSKMSDLDKIKQGMALEKPHLSREDIDLIVESQYQTTPDDVENEAEVKAAKIAAIKLKDDAIRYEKNINEWKVKALEPKIDPEKVRAEQEALLKAEAEEKKRIEFENKYNKDATEALTNFKEIKIKIGEGEQDVFTYQPDAKILESVAEIVKNPNKIFAIWRNQDGTPNIPKMIEDLALLKSAGDLNQKKAAAMEARSLEAYIKGKKNIDFGKGDKNQRQQLDNSESLKELAKQFE